MQARRAFEAFEKVKAPKPNELNTTHTRKVLWDAIGAAHPAYRLYVEAVRLAGHDDDRDILEKTLRPLLSSWTRGNNLRPLAEVREPIGNWGRDVLSDCLRMQTIRDADDAIKLTADLKLVPESATKRTRAIGDPPAMSTRPFPLLRSSGRIAVFDRAAHQAAALQRAGFDVAFWSLAAATKIDASTKSIGQETLIVYPEKTGQMPVIAIGSDEILKPLGGEPVVAGVYRFASLAKLDDFLARTGQFRVAMADVLEANAAPLAWAKAMQTVLTTKPGAGTPREILIELATLDSCGGFNSAATQSFAVTAQAAFIKTLQTQSIRLTISQVKNGKAEPATPIADFAKRDKDKELPKHEAAMGRAFQVLPAKVLDGVQTIQLQSEPLNEKRSIGVRQGARVVVKEVDVPLPGRGWSNRMFLASPNYQIGLHELLHCWAFNRSEVFVSGEWRGTMVDLYNEIAWVRDKDAPGWAIRGVTAKLDDFARDYAATNEKEDLAVTGEYYAVLPKTLRTQVRGQLKKGSLAPAVKYLFMKHIAFLDTDGKGIEYETDAIDPPFTKEELDKSVKALIDRKAYTDEQKRCSKSPGASWPYPWTW